MKHAAMLAVFLGLACTDRPVPGADAGPPGGPATPAAPFVYHTELSRERLQVLHGQLLQLRADLGRSLGLPEASEPIAIHLLPDRASYQRYLRREAPDVPFHEALYIKDEAGARVLAYEGPELEKNLRHEGTHAMLHAALPYLPLWLDEGLAEYYEVRPERQYRGNPHLGRVRWGVRLGTYLRPGDLERIPATREMSEAEYRWSWAWAHFLLHESPQSYQELRSYLAEIRQGGVVDPLSTRLERRLPNLQQRFVRHFRALTPE